MNINEVRAYIDANGGRRKMGINWEWAYFGEDTEKARAVFEHVKAHVEHRGFHEAWLGTDGIVQEAAFRFR